MGVSRSIANPLICMSKCRLCGIDKRRRIWRVYDRQGRSWQGSTQLATARKNSDWRKVRSPGQSTGRITYDGLKSWHFCVGSRPFPCRPNVTILRKKTYSARTIEIKHWNKNVITSVERFISVLFQFYFSFISIVQTLLERHEHFTRNF